MKLLKLSVAAYAILLLSALNSCNSSAQKEEKAAEEVAQAQKDLERAQISQDSIRMKALRDEEWIAFRDLSDRRIKENEARIALLKSDMKKSNKNVDAFYEKKMNSLEKENSRIKLRVDSFKQDESDWESFKREVNHDMEELGKSFNDFTVKNISK